MRLELARVHPARHGLARSSALLLLLAVLAATLLVLFAVSRVAIDDTAVLPVPPTRAAPGVHGPAPEPEEQARTRSVAEIERAHPKPDAPAGVEHQGLDESHGPGVIRGRITAARGTDLPKVWTLVVEPHPFLQGSERAVTRRLEFANGEQEFKVEGLPLAGYNVRAQAAGLNDVACSALLVPGSDNVFVSPQFLPAGFIDGNVIDASGAPAEGILVTITSDSTHARTSARTDARGNYLIAGVTDGNYLLSIGSPEAPLLKQDSLAFKAPSLRFPTRQLPDTGILRVTTVDQSGRALAGTEVSGFSSSGGSLRTTTDARGAAVVRYLQPGRYRLEAKIEDGRRAGQWIDVGAKLETVVELRLMP